MLSIMSSCVALICRHTAAPGEVADESAKPVTARASHAAVALDQRIMLLGGESKGALVSEICIGETVNVQVSMTDRVGQHAAAHMWWHADFVAVVHSWRWLLLAVDCRL